MPFDTTAYALLRIQALLHHLDRHTRHDRRTAESSPTATTARTSSSGGTSSAFLLLTPLRLRLLLGCHTRAAAATLRLQCVEHRARDALLHSSSVATVDVHLANRSGPALRST